jgi:hypothetical protein
MAAVDILFWLSISPGDLEFMKYFSHSSDNTFSALGLDLKKRIAMQVKFFESMSPMTIEAISIDRQSDSLPSMDDFLCNFNRLYLTSEAFRGNLMVGLMSALLPSQKAIEIRSTVRECLISCWRYLQAVTEKLSSFYQQIFAQSQYDTYHA